MAYSVKKLAELSGVSVRTLHYYDEIGLLKPAYHSEGGYRQYEEEQLLLLQQILFYRELGFALKQIKKILGRSDFDKIAALASHREVLMKNVARTGKLIETIDKTIKHLKGEESMKDEELYGGFITKEKQKEYEAYLKNRLGEDHPAFAECEKKAKHLTKQDWEESQRKGDLRMRALVKLMQRQLPPSSPEVQAIVREHFEWLKTLWTPNKESFIGLGQGYTEFEWKKYFGTYDDNHPKLAMYLAAGMKEFAERELS